MTRCRTCDYDHLAPSSFHESVSNGWRAGRVHYRRRLKDFYCDPCYSAILLTIKVGDLRDNHPTSIIDLLTLGDTDVDSLPANTPTLPVRELV